MGIISIVDSTIELEIYSPDERLLIKTPKDGPPVKHIIEDWHQRYRAGGTKYKLRETDLLFREWCRNI